MKPEEKAAIKTAGTFGLIGASLLAIAGNPVAWAALAFATVRVGKAAYREAKQKNLQASQAEDDNLFI